MTDNLTVSQRRLLTVLLSTRKREMVEFGDEIKSEIEKLRQEQEVKRKQPGLLGTIGWTAEGCLLGRRS